MAQGEIYYFGKIGNKEYNTSNKEYTLEPSSTCLEERIILMGQQIGMSQSIKKGDNENEYIETIGEVVVKYKYINGGEDLEINWEYKAVEDKEDTKEGNEDKTSKEEGVGNEEETTIIKNIRNDKTLKLSDSKKDSLCYVTKALLDNDFEPEFIAGVLGNIMAEGEYGLFESSNYKSNPDGLPKYFKYMQNYLKDLNYDQEFSGKKISSVGLKKTCKLVDFTVKSNYKAKFGFGAAQFTGDRTTEIIRKYIEVCGNVTKEYIVNNYIKAGKTYFEEACNAIFKGKEIYPTSEQMLMAESNLIVEELKGVKKYCYEEWRNKHKNEENAVNQSGQIICIKYEVPYDRFNKAITRGNNADLIYKVMMKKG